MDKWINVYEANCFRKKVISMESIQKSEIILVKHKCSMHMRDLPDGITQYFICTLFVVM